MTRMLFHPNSYFYNLLSGYYISNALSVKKRMGRRSKISLVKLSLRSLPLSSFYSLELYRAEELKFLEMKAWILFSHHLLRSWKSGGWHTIGEPVITGCAEGQKDYRVDDIGKENE